MIPLTEVGEEKRVEPPRRQGTEKSEEKGRMMERSRRIVKRKTALDAVNLNSMHQSLFLLSPKLNLLSSLFSVPWRLGGSTLFIFLRSAIITP